MHEQHNSLTAPTVPLNRGARLPWRDYFGLPTLALLSIVLTLAPAEFIARILWPKNTVDSCLVPDSLSGLRYKPNCISKLKIPEGPWVVKKYNDCGFPSASPCRQKSQNALRIAVLGASSAEGHMVPFEQSYAARMEGMLTEQCGRRVEVQNLAVAGTHLMEAAHRAEEALDLKPDLMLLIFTPYDLWKDIGDLESGVSREEEAQTSTSRKWLSLHDRSDALKERIRDSSTLLMVRHFLYQDPGTYLRFYLQTQSGGADYLSPPFSARWRKGFDHLDKMLVEMADDAHEKGVAFGIVPSFQRPQVVLMNNANAFPGKDPYAFEREIAKIAEMRGIWDFEVTQDFRRADRSETLFYPADGHLNSTGHEVLARALVREIARSQVLKQAGCLAVGFAD
jgi:hypothetical protein